MKGSAKLKSENQRLRRQLKDAHQEISILRQKIDALAKRLYGKKTEQLDPGQLELILGQIEREQADPEPEEDEEESKKKRRRGRQRLGRTRAPENLKVVEQRLVPDEVQAQPDQWKEIGQPEVLNQLDYQPAQFFWLRTVRPKFVRLDQRDLPPVIVPAPSRVIERGIASPGLLAQILVSRFVDHLPFYRQEKIYERRHGVWLPRQQMVGWVAHCAAYMDGIYRAMVNQVRQASYVQIDETPITYLDTDEPKGSSKGYFWTYLLPKEQVIFDWHSSRAAACLNRVLGDRFEGKIQCDAYGGYQSYASVREGVMLFGCWAHCRRRFYEALDQDPRIVGWILKQIQRLYLYEKELRESRAGPNHRAFIRGWKSRPIIKRLHKTFTKLLTRYLPKSAMGKALSYALKQWKLLARYIDHGEVEIDDNLVENAIRPTAIGKNYEELSVMLI